MSGASGFEHVVGGKLKLKGNLSVDTSIKKKKKKDKKKSKDLAEGGAGGGGEGKDVVSPTGETPKEDRRTAAEKKYDEQCERMQEKRINQLASSTHRERVAKFNEYLNTLSEHNDIPKVGPG